MIRLIFGLLVWCLTLKADEVYATFDVIADKKANIAFSSSGTVDKILVDIGSNIKEGDILAKLDNRDLKANLEIAKINLENAKVSLKFAQIDFNRQEKIKKVIDKSVFDKYHLALELAKVKVLQMESNLEYAKIALDKTILKAPFDSTVTSKKIEVGDVVSGQMIKTAFVVESLESVKLLLKFDSKYYKDIVVGSEVRYILDGNIVEYFAKVSKIYPTIDTTTRMITAEVDVKNLPVGLFGVAYITIKEN